MMKPSLFIHIGAALAGVMACFTCASNGLATASGLRITVDSLLVHIAIFAPAIIFYVIWLLFLRKQKRDSKVMVVMFWLSLIGASLFASFMGLLYGAFDIDWPLPVTLSPVELATKYFLLACLPVATILLVLYIVSEFVKKGGIDE